MSDEQNVNTTPVPAPNPAVVNTLTGQPVEPPKPEGLNLDTPVTVNGKAYTINELVQNAQKAEELSQQVAERDKSLEETRGIFQTLYNAPADVTEEKMQQAARTAFIQAGLSGTDLEQAMANTFSSQPDETAATTERVGAEADGVNGGLTADQLSQLEQYKIVTQEQLRRDFVQSAEKAVTEDPKAKELLGSIEKILGEDKSKVEGIKKALVQETQDRMKASIQQLLDASSGNAIRPEWFSQVAPKAAEGALEKIRTLAVTADDLGRSAAFGEGEPVGVPSEPVALPTYRPGLNPSTASQERNSYIADKMGRIAAEIANRGTNV